MSTGQDTAIGNGTVVTDRGVQAEVLTADGVHLRYIDQGAGRPVVFVHGWLSCAEHWRPVAAPIAGMARAVTYDQRGHGASDGTEHGWTVHRLARDLDELLAALAISGAVLVGHSMGCSVIWAYLELFGASRVTGSSSSISLRRWSSTRSGTRPPSLGPAPCFAMKSSAPCAAAWPIRNHTSRSPAKP